MTSSYLFHSDGLVNLARYVAPDTLFAFDLDGTLAPIVEAHTGSNICPPAIATLARLNHLAKVAIITGMTRKDALKLLEFEPHLLIGNNGAEWPSGVGKRNWDQIKLCLKWQQQLQEMLGYTLGIEFEFKGESVSLHYHKAEDPAQALSRINAVIEKLDPAPKRISSEFVINLLPPEALTKGKALIAAMDMFGLKRAIFIGDDVTDEEVFQLKNVDVFGIHIGKDDQTAAPYYLKKQSALLGLLNSMVGILETHKEVESHG